MPEFAPRPFTMAQGTLEFCLPTVASDGQQLPPPPENPRHLGGHFIEITALETSWGFGGGFRGFLMAFFG